MVKLGNLMYHFAHTLRSEEVLGRTLDVKLEIETGLNSVVLQARQLNTELRYYKW